jgi:uncharacterized membrane protein
MIPDLTVVQMIILAIIIIHVVSARKTNRVVVSTLALSVVLLHAYDHLFLVKRGEERKIFHN